MNRLVVVFSREEDDSVGFVALVSTDKTTAVFNDDYYAAKNRVIKNDAANWTVDEVLDVLRLQGYEIQVQDDNFSEVWY